MHRACIVALLLARAATTGLAQPAPWIRTNGPMGGDIHFVVTGPGDTLYAGAQLSPGLIRPYRSTDLGASWSVIQGGNGFTFPGPIYSSPAGVLLFAASGTTQEIARSTDGGNSWTEIASGFLPTGFCTDGSGNIYCSSSPGGIFRSTDGGLTWSPANGSLTTTSFSSITADGTGALYAAENAGGSAAAGVYSSTDGGAHWNRSFNYSLTPIQTLFKTPGGSILAGTAGDGIYRTTDGGASWPPAGSGLSNTYVQSFATDDAGNILAGTRHGLFRSTDDGATWSESDNGLMNRYVWALAAKGGEIFSGTAISLYRSTDRGGTWSESATGIVSSFCTLVAANSSGTVLAATNAAGGLYRTTDSGLTWVPANTGLADRKLLSVTTGGNGEFFAGITPDTDGVAVFRSTDQGASWTGLATHMKGRPALALATGPAGEVVAASITGNDGTGVYRSTDNGSSWSTLTTGLANILLNSIAVSKSDFLYAGYQGGLPVSTDGGTTWTDRSTGLPFAPILALGADSANNMYAATGQFGVYRLVAGEWVLTDQGLPSLDEGNIVSIAFDATGDVFGGSTAGGAYILPHGNTAWQRYNTGLTDSAVNTITIDPSGLLYAGTNGDGVYRNGGPPLAVSLSHFSATLSGARAVQLRWTTLSETGNYGFFVERSASPASGFSTITGSVIPGHGTTSVAHDYAYADTAAEEAFPWYRLRQVDLSGGFHYSGSVKAAPLAVPAARNLPETLELLQNYPNPFNPQTTIPYDLASAVHVRLTVYDNIGQECGRLVDELQQPGRYRVTWNPGGTAATGVYFVRIRAGSFVATRKMILVR